MNTLALNIFFTVTSLVSFLFCVFQQHDAPEGYGMLWIQPAIFTIVYHFCLAPLLRSHKFLITCSLYSILAWLRNVVIPFFSAVSGVYNGVSYILVSSTAVEKAILLVSWELVVTSVVLFLICNLRSGKGKWGRNNFLELKGNQLVYAVFIIFSLFLYLTVGRKSNVLGFMVLPTDSAERFTDITSTSLVLLRQIFKCSLLFLFVWVVSYCQNRYKSTLKARYIFGALFLGLLTIGVIIGARRSEQVYTSLIVVFILTQAFVKYKKHIIFFVVGTAVAVLFFMSVYKHFAAYQYGSYSAALESAPINIEWFTIMLQSYFSGPQNVAVAIELKTVGGLDFSNLLYDFARSIFGISFMLKDRMLMTSEHFNTFIYGFYQAHGHVISGAGYGYVYMGFLLSPMIVSLNIFISASLERWFNKTKAFEIKYIAGYMLVRFATNLFASTPPLISLSTIMLCTAGLVYLLAWLFPNPDRNFQMLCK